MVETIEETVYISVASNIRSEENIAGALEILTCHLLLTALSAFYRTPAIDRPEQPPYLNGVAVVRTCISPRLLKFDILRAVEARLGRVRTSDAYAARTIDLDILLYGNRVIDEPTLRIPDPDILERSFLCAALLELAPDLEYPGTGRLLRTLMNAGKQKRLTIEKEFTAQLRERFLNESGKSR